ncbi:hypothetical protein FQZ97_1080040 [compost metagenome]
MRLPAQSGKESGSGRNIPTKIWLRKVLWVFTLTGRLTEANTLLVAWISEKMAFSASAIWLPSLVTSKYLPLLTLAMLRSSAVQPGPWPVVTRLTSTV